MRNSQEGYTALWFYEKCKKYSVHNIQKIKGN